MFLFLFILLFIFNDLALFFFLFSSLRFPFPPPSILSIQPKKICFPVLCSFILSGFNRYTQTGTGHIDFRWDAPTEPNGAWVDVATWTATKAATKPQIFNIPAGGGAVTGDTFRVQFVDTYGGFQAFVRELAIQATTTTTTTTAPAWLPNRATPTNPAPLSGSSGWQSNHAGSGGVWCAMDGNATTIWDPTVNSDSWLELSYPTPITVAALSVLVEGDGTHDAKVRALRPPVLPSSRPPILPPSIFFPVFFSS